ncbi:MAG: TIGR02221 family CRISPR-associated protein [Syntrophaceae bacterium]|nr:TIGR02221 family CRISPR-associated protein [Syntrophaceae bacterium]
MGNVYISFLGTNDYIPCTYLLEEKEARNVRFVQEGTARFFCQNWTEEDRILFFMTEEAYKKNWLDDGHTDRDGNTPKRSGLKRCLEQLNFKPILEEIPIPSGKSLSEIWKIFQIVFDQLKQGDEIVFDITHALRSIPMLAMVVLNYAKVMKDISITGIYYGAFETLGSVKEAEKIPEEKRRCPVFDLTAFDSLLDWSLAIDSFIGAGDAVPVCTLSRKAIHPILKKSKGRDTSAAAMRDLGNKLQNFTKTMYACRGRKIPQAVNDLKEQLKVCEGLEVLPPFQPLLTKISHELHDFTGEQIRDGIQAVTWCYDHNLIQQGYTIMREVLINFLATKVGLDHNNQKNREIASQAVKISQQNIKIQDWKAPSADYPETTNEYLAYLKNEPEISRIYSEIMKYRNDINHAGYRDNPMQADRFGKKLKGLVADLKRHL